MRHARTLDEVAEVSGYFGSSDLDHAPRLFRQVRMAHGAAGGSKGECRRRGGLPNSRNLHPIVGELRPRRQDEQAAQSLGSKAAIRMAGSCKGLRRDLAWLQPGRPVPGRFRPREPAAELRPGTLGPGRSRRLECSCAGNAPAHPGLRAGCLLWRRAPRRRPRTALDCQACSR